MSEEQRFVRRLRKQVDEPGLRLSIAADVNAVVSTGSTTSSSTQHVHVRQGRSSRTTPPSTEKEQS